MSPPQDRKKQVDICPLERRPMKIITRTQFLPPNNDPAPLLTIAEKLEPVKLELIQEVDNSGEMIDEIVLHVPRNRDMLDNQMNVDRTPDSTYRMLAKACDAVTPEAVEALHPRDLNYLSRMYFAYQE